MLGKGGHLGLAVVEVAVVTAVVVVVEVVIAVGVRTILTIMQQPMIMASTFIPDFRSAYGTVFLLL